jgi:hypothetical protein
LARRKSGVALDRHRAVGSREKVPPHQRLARNRVAEGTPESLAHSAEGGLHRRSRLNLIRGRLTVPNIKSRCNRLKLGHPRKFGPCARNISSNPIGNPNEPKMSTRHSNLIALLCPLEIFKFLLAPSVSHGITC